VRVYVRERKRELGWSTRTTCVPQSYGPGQEGQVDWYEAWAELGGAPVKLQVFSLRSMASGAAFHRAYYRATQQAFLEAHEQAFHYFGGVFRLLRYDNLKSAVKRILRGHQREETTRFIAFRSHWRFQSDFCTPAEPHEKGGIEGEAGYFRRNHWVPVPQVRNRDELNARVLAACHVDERRQIAGHDTAVGAALIDERAQLLPLAAWRARGLWPPSYDRLLAQLIERPGKPSGTRQMIQLLSLIRSHGHERVRAAIEEALGLGCADAAAVRHLVEAVDLAHAGGALIELDARSRFERPLPALTDYDGLLDQEVTP
jgi:hypothetical protein